MARKGCTRIVAKRSAASEISVAPRTNLSRLKMGNPRINPENPSRRWCTENDLLYENAPSSFVEVIRAVETLEEMTLSASKVEVRKA